MFSVYAVVCYVVSLRGVEGFLLDLAGLIRYWNDEKKEQVIIALLGKIKRESNDTAHIILCVSVISPDINVKRLLRRLINVNTKLGLRDGPTISGDTGKLLEPSDLDEMVIELLMEYHSENRELFPVDMDTQEKIRNSYQCFRTFRRTSDTRVLEKILNKSDIDIVNR